MHLLLHGLKKHPILQNEILLDPSHHSCNLDNILTFNKMFYVAFIHAFMAFYHTKFRVANYVEQRLLSPDKKAFNTIVVLLYPSLDDRNDTHFKDSHILYNLSGPRTVTSNTKF
jgi:hypothetical protein